MDLPSGTVTLLFSDMEGSTRMLNELGAESYGSVMDAQRSIQRDAWALHDGIELGTEGDSFYVVFGTAEQAVAAAVHAQQRLGAHVWPPGQAVAIRMGLHSGAPRRHGDGYVGIDVHRAARIAAAAHGGQVVISTSTAALAGASISVRDLGEHRLKDLAQPERLFQVRADGLRDDFGPLRTLGSTSTLPTPATPLLGRDGELAELGAAVEEQGVRLVTLTGPGGTGKTRLALAVAESLADHFRDGAYFVPLETASTAEDVWTSIAAAVNVPAESRGLSGLLEHLAQRECLLVLDNLEQAHEAADVTSQIMDAARGVRLLCTSRVPLQITGEREHSVPPLELPTAGGLADVRTAGAVQMFVHHAQMVRRGFVLDEHNYVAVRAICERLDALPLALELVAARLKMLTPQALLDRLDGFLDIASGDTRRPRRQQTMRQAIEWSYDLLDDDQQRVLRALAVFPAGAGLSALEQLLPQLAGLGSANVFDLLEGLADASLVNVVDGPDGDPRAGLLNTIRVFAMEQLDGHGETDGVYAAMLGQLQRETVDAGAADTSILERPYNERYEREYPNIQGAMTWLCNDAGWQDADQGWVDQQLVFMSEVVRVGMRRGHAEVAAWGRRVLERGDSGSPRLLVELRLMLADFAQTRGDVDEARQHGGAALKTLARVPSDELGSRALMSLTSGAHQVLALAAHAQGDLEDAAHEYEAALALAAPESARRCVVLLNLAILEGDQGHTDRVYQLEREADQLAQRLGHSYLLLWARNNMACSLRERGHAQEALEIFLDLLPEVLALKDPASMALACEDLSSALIDVGRPRDAALIIGAVDAHRRRFGVPRDPAQLAEMTPSLAAARAELGDAWADLLVRGEQLTVEEAVGAAVASDQ